MPNGFMGPKHEWQRMEAPYVRIDAILSAFADRHGLVVQKNYRDADRSLQCNDSLNRAIWINSSDQFGASGTYEVSVLAHQDRPERFVKGERIATDVAISDLDGVLHRALKVSSAWSPADLQRDFPPEFRRVPETAVGTAKRLARFVVMIPVAVAFNAVALLVSTFVSVRDQFRGDKD